MLTHFVKSINWVDVALAILLVRVIFISVKSGFITELFKIFATVAAVFVSLHYFSYLAAIINKSTQFSIGILEFAVFIGLWGAVMLVMKLLRSGLLMLFKAETTNPGFNQYAAGILAVGRGLLLCSLAIFAVLLMRQDGLGRMALNSFAYQIAGKAAPGSYAFLQHQVIGKLWENVKYNDAVDVVMRGQAK
jgi:uncharacterized membrane protein required for colicin V production